MKSLVKLYTGLVMLFAPMALAADLPARTYVATAPTFVSAHNWTGLYVGLQGGYGFSGKSGLDLVPGTWDTRGAFGGVTVGANLQIDRVVVGLEADGDFAGIKASRSFEGTNVSIKPDVFGTVRGRVGYDFNGLLPYVTAGVYGQRSKASIAGFGLSTSASDTAIGWTAGGGVEWALTPAWSVKGEYLYAKTGKQNYTFPVFGGFGIGSGVDGSQSIVRFGVNYHL